MSKVETAIIHRIEKHAVLVDGLQIGQVQRTTYGGWDAFSRENALITVGPSAETLDEAVAIVVAVHEQES